LRTLIRGVATADFAGSAPRHRSSYRVESARRTSLYPGLRGHRRSAESAWRASL